MNPKRILIAGCGDVGIALGKLLAAQGHTVFGLRRTTRLLPDGIQGISADLSNKDTLSNLPSIDILVHCAAAGGSGEQGYIDTYISGVDNLLNALPSPPSHIFFTSSTSVYGQNDHSWVDESSPTTPDSATGQIMCEAEQRVLSHPHATVVRFSGIYGPNRNHLINAVKQGISAPASQLHYSNRIHRDDCAGILSFLIGKQITGESIDSLYLASDLSPTPIADITQWLAEQLGIEITTEKEIRRGGSKRCNSQKIQQAGYRFKFPDFKSGFASQLDESNLS
jgi:nucleoside-diphosphate-sugar epimerase